MSANTLDVTYRKIADLRSYTNNPRVHNRAQRRKINSILRRFGQVAPIIIDPEGVIIDGHLIVEEISSLGFDEVATVTVRNRDPAEIRA
ncbi:MAG: hypothetical protein GEU92_21195, partial [Alphaproteobacteria bacterium]|nr:hypothetical protein [Alphaproteobacteria bacterium]